MSEESFKDLTNYQKERLMKVLTNHNRLNILNLMIIHKRLSLGQLHELLGKSKATVVYHMSKFEDTGLIIEKHEKVPNTSKIVKFYEINPNYPQLISFGSPEFLEELLNPEHDDQEVRNLYKDFLISLLNAVKYQINMIIENLKNQDIFSLREMGNVKTNQIEFIHDLAINLIPIEKGALEEFEADEDRLLEKYYAKSKTKFDEKDLTKTPHIAYLLKIPTAIANGLSESHENNINGKNKKNLGNA
jgi:DNA-binding transcriptional ArsR family regulator